MLALAIPERPSWRMAEPTTAERADRVVWGRALRALRLKSGKTLQQASANYRRFGQRVGDPARGLSVQRWQQAEKGNATFGEEQASRYAEALGRSFDDLLTERARILGEVPRRSSSGFAERETRPLVIPIFGRPELDAGGWKIGNGQVTEGGFDLRELLTPAIGVTYVADDSMAGWSEPGAMVIFDRSKRPIEGRGCVVETLAGDLYPRIFVGIDEEHVLVRATASPKIIPFRRQEVRGVYAVRLRGN